MYKIIRLFLIFALNFICILDVQAATIPATTCSRADVQAAITAASNGDTVTIPTGTCVWSSKVTITKSLTIQGAGIDETVITQGFIINSGVNDYRITGITFDGKWGPHTLFTMHSPELEISGLELTTVSL